MMLFHPLRGSCALLACVLAASPALADLTADQVWAEWRAYAAASGYEMTATESRSGDTLTVSDVKMTVKAAEDNADATVTFPQIALTDKGDGTVEVTLPNPLPIGFAFTAPDTPAGAGEIVMTHQGTSMTISGDPGNMVYDQSMDSLEVTLGEVTREGETMPPELMGFTMTASDLASNTAVAIDGARTFTQTMTVGSVGLDMAFQDPETGDSGTLKGAMRGLTFEGGGVIPADMDPGDMAAAVAGGFRADGRFAFESGDSALAGSGSDGDFSASTTSQGGSLSVSMSQAGLAYGLQSNAPSVSVTTATLPFPVEAQMGAAAFNLAMPVSKSDEAQDFSLLVKLTDFTMSDMIWSMVDPGSALPRDPASIALDLSGKAKLAIDLMNPEAAIAAGDAPPGELESLSINELLVSVVGARLTGTGAFTFDETDMETFPGMPAPEGQLNLTLTGANALMDKLIAMGLLSDQDAMGARMMMGMMAVPGDGPDSLKSTIEINDQGHILANGQRIR